MTAGNVPPKVQRLTDADYRRVVARGIRRVSAASGAGRYGIEVGCNEKTMRSARDEKSSLDGSTLWNQLVVDGTALDELAAHFGKRLVDIDPGESDDRRLLADTMALCAAYAEAMVDGRVDHLEAPKLAALARSVLSGWAGRVAAA